MYELASMAAGSGTAHFVVPQALVQTESLTSNLGHSPFYWVPFFSVLEPFHAKKGHPPHDFLDCGNSR